MTLIGRSSLDVYPLCLGANPFGWTTDQEGAHAVLDEYVDNGGNFIDTADVYGMRGSEGVVGTSETMIGQWLINRPRAELVVASKVGYLNPEGDLAASNVTRSLDASLQRLQTDYLDLYYAHKFDPATPIPETVAAFAQAQTSGKIREIGLSNMTPEQIREWMAAADDQGVPRPIALQPPYNLVRRVPYETLWQPLADEFDLGVMTYWSLAGGLLTGKYSPDREITGERARTVTKHASKRAFEVVEAVKLIAAEHNVDPAAVAIAWLLENPTVTAPIASARTPAQVGPMMEGVTIQLTADNMEVLDQLSQGLGAEPGQD